MQVTSPYFCAGIIMREGWCVEAAPILRWCVGKRRETLSRTFKRKGWKAVIVATK